jgi:hypothetical protein
MTLCMAWKQNSKFYFASDSRLTGDNNNEITDDATKIFKIEAKIYGPMEREDDRPSLLMQRRFGMCFAGSYLNGSILAQASEGILSGISVTSISEISIDDLSKILFNVYRQISYELGLRHGFAGLAEVLFGGYCPKTNAFKLYKFSWRYDDNNVVEYYREECAIGNQPILLGDGKEKALQKITDINNEYTCFHLLRDMICDESIISVGGPIQVGVFFENSFDVNGVIEYSFHEDGNGVRTLIEKYTFRGFDLNFDNNEFGLGHIINNNIFEDPFFKERDAYFNDDLGE